MEICTLITADLLGERNVLQVASAARAMAVCTATVTVEPWWLYLPLVMRLFP
jgi:hypothetical protein